MLHFASPASPIDYLEKPIQTLKVGSLGTHNTLGLAKDKGARFLIASTSEVYGDPLVHPQKEDYWGNVNPVGPRGVYDEAKRFAEAMTMAYHRFHGVETRIVRIFNTYGPRMRIKDGRVVPAFISQALRNEPLTVFGDGSQTRSFCYVSDLVEGIYRLLMSDEANPTNIGNPNEMTVLQFAEEIKRADRARARRSSSGRCPRTIRRFAGPTSPRRARSSEWEPGVPLDEGLHEDDRLLSKGAVMIKRVVIAFAAGFVSTLVFHQCVLALLHTFGIAPRARVGDAGRCRRSAFRR